MEKTDIKKDLKKVDVEQINEVVFLSKNILKVINVFVVLAVVYLMVILLKHFNILPVVFVIFKVISPLFIGLFIAWLFNPIVRKLKTKKVKRGFGTLIVYTVFLGFIVLIISSIVPILTKQTNEIVNIIPGIVSDIKLWLSNIIDKLSSIDGFDTEGLKTEVFAKIEDYATNITSSLPDTFVNVFKPILSGMWSFVIGLVIGFYLLMGFDDVEGTLLNWLPKKIQSDAKRLFTELNATLRRFLKGAFWDSMVVFVATSIGFSIIGLESPLLFGLFCGITNVIPYAGPYIGGAPAVLVGFSGGLVKGIFTLLIILVVQMLEGNLLQPLIMSKSTKLHPVTIILGLLLFGYFFGIFGMLISTPTISCLKTIFKFFDEKYDFLSYKK